MRRTPGARGRRPGRGRRRGGAARARPVARQGCGCAAAAARRRPHRHPLPGPPPRHLKDLLADQKRCEALIKEDLGLYIDFSRQRMTPETTKARRAPCDRRRAAAPPRSALPPHG